MKVQPIESQMNALVEAARSRKLSILTGAGVSALPPASLPTWWQLNIAAIRETTVGHASLSEMQSEVETLDLPPALLAQALWDVAGDRYFDCLDVLARGTPNANHRLIAGLAQASMVREIFTLNFDLLQEAALTAHGVKYELGDDATASADKTALQLHKLHGSIDDKASIRATLEQTSNRDGIGIGKKRLIETARRAGPMLVIGYSGGDFFLDPDYLGLVSLPVSTPIIWNVRRGEVASKGHPLWQLKALCPSLVICEGLLPDLLFDLARGCDLHTAGIERPEEAQCPPKLVGWIPPKGVWPGQVLANVFRNGDRRERELDAYRWELRAAMSDASPHRTSWAVSGIGQWYAAHGHLIVARLLLEAAVDLARLLADRLGEAVALGDLAFVHMRERESELALSRFKESLEASMDLGFTKHAAITHNNIGLVHQERGEYGPARLHFESALDLAKEGFPSIRSTALANLGLVFGKCGETEQARRSLSEALRIDEALRNRAGTAQNLRNLGHLLLEGGDYEGARVHLERAVEVQRSFEDPYRRIPVLEMLADAQRMLGRVNEAMESYEEAAKLADKIADLYYGEYRAKYYRRRARELRASTGSPAESSDAPHS